MTFEELLDRQENELFRCFMEAEASYELMFRDKLLLVRLMYSAPFNMRKQLQEKIDREHDKWVKEWGSQGTQIQDLEKIHKQEIEKFQADEKLENSVQLQIKEYIEAKKFRENHQRNFHGRER